MQLSSPERFARVRAMILEALEKGGAPSLSIAVAENGKVVWEEGFGYADKEKKIPATPDSIYALASISKSFTADGPDGAGPEEAHRLGQAGQ